MWFFARFGTICTIKKHEKHPWRSVIFIKLQAKACCNFTKSNTPPWVFFTAFKLYKWYQIAQSTPYLFSQKLLARISLEIHHFLWKYATFFTSCCLEVFLKTSALEVSPKQVHLIESTTDSFPESLCDF